MNLKPHQKAILGASTLALLSTVVPVLSKLFLPVLWLDTHIHEFCHAVVALACGGQVGNIHVYADGSGVTLVAGGNAILEGSAGYMGASVVGALMIFFSRSANAAKNTLRALAFVLALSMVTLVRGDLVGIVSGIGWAAALFGLAHFLDGYWMIFTAQLLGLLQCVNAVQAIYELLQISAFTEGQSDAMMLQHATGIPALVWAVSWCSFSVALIAFTLHRAWRGRPTMAKAA